MAPQKFIESKCVLLTTLIFAGLGILFSIVAIATPWTLWKYEIFDQTVNYKYWLKKSCVDGGISGKQCRDYDGNEQGILDGIKAAGKTGVAMHVLCILMLIPVAGVAVLRLMRKGNTMISAGAGGISFVAFIFVLAASGNWSNHDWADADKVLNSLGGVGKVTVYAGAGLGMGYTSCFVFLLPIAVMLVFFRQCCTCCKQAVTGDDSTTYNPLGGGAPVGAPVAAYNAPPPTAPSGV